MAQHQMLPNLGQQPVLLLVNRTSTWSYSRYGSKNAPRRAGAPASLFLLARRPLLSAKKIPNSHLKVLDVFKGFAEGGGGAFQPPPSLPP